MRPLRVYIAEGIILKRLQAGEADRIITVFAKKYGKIRIIAKGIRRINSRRAGHLEVFSHVMLTLHGSKTLDSLSEAHSVRSGSVFDTDAARMGFAYCMCELVDQLLADRQVHDDIFYALRDGLHQLLVCGSTEEWEKIFTDFVHTLLRNLGFLPHSRSVPVENMQTYIERITERRLRTWPLSVMN
jgi:DNA repair protein RecO (recombination protein O)